MMGKKILDRTKFKVETTLKLILTIKLKLFATDDMVLCERAIELDKEINSCVVPKTRFSRNSEASVSEL